MKKEFKNFEDAIKFVRGLGIKTKDDWLNYCKSGNKPDDMPSSIEIFYKDKGWNGWGDFTGTGRQRQIDFHSYVDASKIVKKLGIKSGSDWKKYCKSGNRPDNIPINPDQSYKNKGWISWSDFLGSKHRRGSFRSFKKAKIFTKSLKLNSRIDWNTYCKSDNRPDDVPFAPNIVYKNKGWISWSDWLGTGRQRQIDFDSYVNVKKFVRGLGIKTRFDWLNYCKSGKKPKDIPNWPDSVYKNKGWISWSDFFGSENVRSMNHWSFESSKDFVIRLGLKNQKDWFTYCKSGNKPDNIPTNPERRYKKEWKGMGDWLGTGRISDQERSKNFLSFSDAKTVVQKLATKYNLKTNADWNKAVKDGLIPDTIPASPWYVYSKKREK